MGGMTGEEQLFSRSLLIPVERDDHSWEWCTSHFRRPRTRHPRQHSPGGALVLAADLAEFATSFHRKHLCETTHPHSRRGNGGIVCHILHGVRKRRRYAIVDGSRALDATCSIPDKFLTCDCKVHSHHSTGIVIFVC